MFLPLARPGARGNGAGPESHVGQVEQRKNVTIDGWATHKTFHELNEKTFSRKLEPVPVSTDSKGVGPPLGPREASSVSALLPVIYG